jgi:hypothetical protein
VNFVAFGKQLPREVGADKPACAGDQDAAGQISASRAGRTRCS